MSNDIQSAVTSVRSLDVGFALALIGLTARTAFELVRSQASRGDKAEQAGERSVMKERLHDLRDEMAAVSTRVAVVETRHVDIVGRLDRIERHLDGLGDKMDRILQRGAGA